MARIRFIMNIDEDLNREVRSAIAAENGGAWKKGGICAFVEDALRSKLRSIPQRIAPVPSASSSGTTGTTRIEQVTGVPVVEYVYKCAVCGELYPINTVHFCSIGNTGGVQ